MSFEHLLNYILLPPTGSFVLVAVGFYLRKKFRRAAYSCFVASFSYIYLLSMPVFSQFVMSAIEAKSELSSYDIKQLATQFSNGNEKSAIVVFSSGRIKSLPDSDQIDFVDDATLQRLQYAAKLNKKTEIPVLVSGGGEKKEATSEAVLMNQAMSVNFGVMPKWVENTSNSLPEMAKNVQNILVEEKISRIILVSHAWNIERAQKLFTYTGLNVTKAPVSWKSTRNNESGIIKYLPSANALSDSNLALTEFCLLWWDRLLYSLD